MVVNRVGVKVSTQTDSDLLTKLSALGLSDDEASAYLVLIEQGPTSVLGLSRTLEIPRTNVYRLIAQLEHDGLVEMRDGIRGVVVAPRAHEALEDVVLENQRAVDRQKELLPSLLGELANLSGKGPLGSRIHYYEGIEGLKRVTRNSLEARNNLCIYELENMTAFTGVEFAEQMRAEIVKRKIHHRQLTNLPAFDGYTDITEIANYWEIRYVDPTELKIEFEVLIYNDVYAVYTYRNDEIFCAEIRSPALAGMQRNLFDLVWSKAKKMKQTDARLGHAVAAKSKPTRRL